MDKVAKRWGGSSFTVHRQVKALLTTGSPRVNLHAGRPTALTHGEEDALIAYCIFLQKGNFPALIEMVQGAANCLRASRNPPAPALHDRWAQRWLKSHPNILEVNKFKAVDVKRRIFEVNEGAVNAYFDHLEREIQEFNILVPDMWNADEAGVQIGVLASGTVKVIVLKENVKRKVGTLPLLLSYIHAYLVLQPEIDNPNNRESSTLIAGGSAMGHKIPLYIIFKSNAVEAFAATNIDRRIRFAQSPTGFSNAELFLDWLQHFNRHSWEESSTCQALGFSFTEWFGHDETGYIDGTKDMVPNEHGNLELRHAGARCVSPPIYRLLIIDGFSAHVDIRAAEYATHFDIRIVPLPPNSTHLTQPCDVSVFQPLKAMHQKVMREAVQHGALNFSRLDYVASLDVSVLKSGHIYQ